MVELGKPFRIDSDAEITFSGEGKASFRIQHARDQDGVPDPLSWCEASALSNAAFDQGRVIKNEDGPTEKHPARSVRGTLIDEIDGETVVTYRRFTAHWLRVLPRDDQDKEGLERCKAYSISIRPLVIV